MWPQSFKLGRELTRLRPDAAVFCLRAVPVAMNALSRARSRRGVAMNSAGNRAGSERAMPIGVRTSAPRAAVYLRVSTGRQAEQGLSIPGQKAQTRAWATTGGLRRC